MPRFFSPATGAISPADGNFDRVAWFYDALAKSVFGGALRRAQQAALEHLPPGAPHVLVLGGGSGWVLEEILHRRPGASVLYLEASQAMLRRARQRLQRKRPGQHRVEFRHGTEARLLPGETFDVVTTFFVLDCLPPGTFETALARLHAALRPAGCWLLADFSPPRHWWQQGLLGAMYLFFRITARLRARQLPPYPGALSALGMQPVFQARFFGGAVLAQALCKQPGPHSQQF